MEYVIDPSIFYWADVLTGIKVATCVLGSALFIPAGIMTFSNLIDGGYSDPDFKWKTILVLAFFAIIFLLVAIFVPDKGTIFEMTAANIITRDNLSIGKEAIIDIIKQIADATKGGK